ncbi:MAG: ERF family protein [Bacteroides sp.]|nr:ERF family protein [Eubacterium sp.]MCM1417642.1 ERF family protein [Roseburia sp.]MCM1461893.1 ERF family protein [Bacteroides sp.]
MKTQSQTEQADLTPANIYEKLSMIAENVKILKKSKSGYGYTYVPIEDILAGIQGKMKELGVMLIPEIGGSDCVFPEQTKVTYDKAGNRQEKPVNELVISGKITFTWVNIHNPDERLSIPWYYYGKQEDASQAFGSALTYATRYFLLSFFQCATADDPDRIVAKKKELEAQENKRIISDISDQIDQIGKDFVAKYPDKRDALWDTIRKNTVDGNGKKPENYRELQSPAAASALLKAINEFVNSTEAK